MGQTAIESGHSGGRQYRICGHRRCWKVMGYRVGHRRLRVGHSGGKQCCICGHRRSWKVIGVF